MSAGAERFAFDLAAGSLAGIDWGGHGLPLAHIDHGTGLCAGTYGPLARRLTDQLHVVGLDARGHGRSTAPADATRLRDWDGFVADLARYFASLPQPPVAIGHSRGGVVSLLLAIRRPELVRAVVLLDPTILPRSWRWPWRLAKRAGLARRVPIAARAARRSARFPDRRTMVAAYRGRVPFASWQPGFLEGYVAGGTVDEGEGEEGEGVRLGCAPAWEAACFASCPHDVWAELPGLRRPLLVIHGAETDVFLPSAARRLARTVPTAELVAVPGAGHFVPMERPDVTARGIVGFLGRRGLLAPK